jgi:hypothetical protein
MDWTLAMMVYAVVLLLLTLPLLLALAFLIGRALQARRTAHVAVSPVIRQHFEIFQTGRVNEEAVEAAKRRFRAMLERGEEEKVEACLRPGTQFFFHVRALAEIGTDAAGEILERQLGRRLADDQLEQSWYWIDLAGGLRAVGREESLPHLLRCAAVALDSPLGHFYAAETSCFMGFGGYLRQPEAPLGRSALRVLHRALEGLRFGVQPHIVAEARIGETIEGLWESRPDDCSPLLVRVLIEALRLVRRAPHAQTFFGEEYAEREAFDWQISRLASLEPAFREYLREAPNALIEWLPRAQGPELAEVLQALDDLRADTGHALLKLAQRLGEHRERTIELLRWSRDPQVGRWLCAYVARHVPLLRRARQRPRPSTPRRPSLPEDVPYRAILYALRGHPSAEAEQVLIMASYDWDPLYRTAAYGSLGWWEPLLAKEAHATLRVGRRDLNPAVRQAARAAAARLGERLALQWFRQAIATDATPGIFEAVQVIANEGIVLLWPDLDRLADSSNLELALHAREATERLAEEMER